MRLIATLAVGGLIALAVPGGSASAAMIAPGPHFDAVSSQAHAGIVKADYYHHDDWHHHWHHEYREQWHPEWHHHWRGHWYHHHWYGY